MIAAACASVTDKPFFRIRVTVAVHPAWSFVTPTTLSSG